MEWIFIIAFALALPFLIWAGIASIMGVKVFYSGTSTWIIVCEMASVYLIPVGVLLYRTLKKRNHPWATSVLTTALVLFIPSAIFVGYDISTYHRVPFSEWRDSIITSCRSFPKDSSPTTKPAKITDTIWMMYTGQYPLVPPSVPGDTPEEWAKAVRFIAVVDEIVQPTDYEYVDEKTNFKLGIRAVQYTWKVLVCDLLNKRIVAETTIVGLPPPEKISSSTAAGASNRMYGILPFDEYDAWIKTLTGQ